MSAPASRLPRLAGFFALQTAVWVVLTFAFATLIEVAGWAAWNDALFFSAVQWAPWIAIAPVVFWLARRFPLERGHLWRSVPIHLCACLACSVAAIWVSASFAPGARLPSGPRVPSGPRTTGSERSSFRSELRSEGHSGFGSSRSPGDWRPPEKPPAPSPSDAKAPATHASSPTARAARAAEWWRDRRDSLRAVGGRSARDHSVFRPAPFRGPAPPAATGVPAMLRRWAFLSSFWPPFSGVFLRINFTAALYLIITTVAQALGYYRSAQERQSQALALTAGLNRAKLDALRLQLQPHFLFNTLNAISTLVHRNPDAADELIADLSELLRLSLQSADHEVPLARELELLDCYLAIEQTRLGEKLRVIRDIDPAVRDVMVPTFVLQPLAENAVRHGLEPRRELGTLTISARVVDGKLRLVVGDDGVGIDSLSGGAPRRGVGLANTEQRLRALHGEAAQLELIAPDSGGVQVCLTLPLHRTPSPKAAPA